MYMHARKPDLSPKLLNRPVAMVGGMVPGNDVSCDHPHHCDPNILHADYKKGIGWPVIGDRCRRTAVRTAMGPDSNMLGLHRAVLQQQHHPMYAAAIIYHYGRSLQALEAAMPSRVKR